MKAIIVFAISDREASGYAPQDKIAIYAQPGYVPADGRFNPIEGGRFTRD